MPPTPATNITWREQSRLPLQGPPSPPPSCSVPHHPGTTAPKVEGIGAFLSTPPLPAVLGPPHHPGGPPRRQAWACMGGDGDGGGSKSTAHHRIQKCCDETFGEPLWVSCSEPNKRFRGFACVTFPMYKKVNTISLY